MPLSISSPSGNADCDCSSTPKKVSVQGSGASMGGTPANKVYGLIVGPNDACPASPPTGAASVTPDASGNYDLGMVGGANCSSSAPYPANKICVWAQYPASLKADVMSSSSSSSSAPVTYDTAEGPFNGKCASA
jgi:hypothetical protein